MKYSSHKQNTFIDHNMKDGSLTTFFLLSVDTQVITYRNYINLTKCSNKRLIKNM